MTVAGAHVLVAIARLVGFTDQRVNPGEFLTVMPSDPFTLSWVASFLVDRLLALAPGCFSSATSDLTISFGTLCSGTDGIMLMAQAIAADISRRIGLPRVAIVQEGRESESGREWEEREKVCVWMHIY